MARTSSQQQEPIDFRIYLGMIFFRWKVVIAFFLYCLLAGVLYIQYAPKKFIATSTISVSRDATLAVNNAGARWSSASAHARMLQDQNMRAEVARELLPDWGGVMGGEHNMHLHVAVERHEHRLDVTVASPNRRYAIAFLRTLIREHKSRWHHLQRVSTSNAIRMLEEELAKMEERIRAAQEDVLQYRRIHDIARLTARQSLEQGYIRSLVSQRHRLNTQIYMLEAENPELQGASLAVINDVERFTQAVDGLDAFEAPEAEQTEAEGEGYLPEDLLTSEDSELALFKERGHQTMRLRLVELQAQEEALRSRVKPGHPQLTAVQGQIASINRSLERAAKLKRRNLVDRLKALTITRNAIEAAEYKWQARSARVEQKLTELSRLEGIVSRLQGNYQTLWTRLHDMRISRELKAERFNASSVTCSLNPVWPNPSKILLMALVVGLGGGFGLAFTLQVLDNKIQTISDVEEGLGIAFLGGIPYWVHSGLENTIRPIVTEEHSGGAIEAYRALRTGIIAAMEEINEKVLLITSADSREGKTLTALNVAIMIAQMNKKVLIVDMDLRRGRLHRSLGMERGPGMTEALREGRGIHEHAAATRIDNLDLVPAGSSVEDAAELLQASDLNHLFAGAQEKYDYVVVDSSPLLRVTDTVILATHGPGAVLYVARVNNTPKPLIRYSLDMLSGARILGLVMNSIEMHKISSLYYAYQYPNYAYYSNAYSYGYSYYYEGDGHAGRRQRRAFQRLWSRTGKAVGQWFRNTLFPMR